MSAAAELLKFYDDFSALLQGWRNLLARPDVVKNPIRRRLVRAYVYRAKDWAGLGPEDVKRVRTLLEENLRDDPTDGASILDWLRVARVEDASLDRAAELVSYWADATGSREALFYDYVMAMVTVIDGRESMLGQAERKLERCRVKSSEFGNRRLRREWLGPGDGLRALVHFSDVDREAEEQEAGVLRRVTGRVTHIRGRQAGTVTLSSGIAVFCVPGRAGLEAGRDENARVSLFVAFTYDGPTAWGLQLLDGGH